jgi:7-carboxy-7-deazaguanine synthase
VVGGQWLVRFVLMMLVRSLQTRRQSLMNKSSLKHSFNTEKRQPKLTTDHRPLSTEVMLRVTEIFRSIQGESSHAGRPCAFVRLTGCPMRCVWCDSAYTFTGGERMTVDEVLAQVRAFGCRLVEVTGGEPLVQREAFELIRRLCDENYEVLIETGGYVSTEAVDARASIILDVKCPLSGEAERNHWANLARLRAEKDEVKFVIAGRDDWEFARRIIKEYDLERRAKAVLISPVWNAVDLRRLADWIAASGLNVRMQIQMHKVIWGADARGV